MTSDPTPAKAPSRSIDVRTLIALGAIIALAVGLRVAWIAHVNVHPLDGRADDTVFYFASARWLGESFEYRDIWGRLTAHWPPGYPLLISPVFWFGESLAAVKAINVIAAAVTLVIVFLFASRAFDTATGLVAALLLAVLPGHIYFSTLVMTETVFTMLFMLFFYLLCIWTLERRTTSALALVALGVLLGYAALVRAEAIFLAPAVVLLWFVRLPRWRTPGRYTLLLAAGVTLVIGVWTVRNAVQFDAFIPLRTGSDGALSNSFDRHYLDRPDRFTGPAPPLDDTLGYIARHPWEIVPLQVDKLVHLYRNDHEGVDWVMHEVPPMQESEAARWRQVADLTYALAMAAAILSAPLWLQIRIPARLALAYALLSWTAIQLMFWPEPRYHVALLPVLSIFAASGTVWAVQQFWRWLASHRRGTVIDGSAATRPSALGE